MMMVNWKHEPMHSPHSPPQIPSKPSSSSSLPCNLHAVSSAELLRCIMRIYRWRCSSNCCLFGQKICTGAHVARCGAPQGSDWISAGHRPSQSSSALPGGTGQSQHLASAVPPSTSSSSCASSPHQVAPLPCPFSLGRLPTLGFQETIFGGLFTSGAPQDEHNNNVIANGAMLRGIWPSQRFLGVLGTM